MRNPEDDKPMELFQETVKMLEELANASQQFEYVAFGYVVD
jgi:hypothetical protein